MRKSFTILSWTVLLILASCACWASLASVSAPLVGWKEALLKTTFALAMPQVLVCVAPLARRRLIGILGLVGLCVGRVWVGVEPASEGASQLLAGAGTVSWGVLGSLCWEKLLKHSMPPRRQGLKIPLDPSVN